MGDLIKSSGAYKNTDIPQALKDAFVECDKSILLPEGDLELKRINRENKPADE